MIGSAARPIGRLTGIGSALLLGTLLALRPPGAEAGDPALAASRAAVLHRLVAADDARLAALAAELQRAIEAGRRGSALIIEGETPPAGDLERAAEAASRSADLAVASQRADAAVDGTLRSVAPGGVTTLPAGPRRGDLVGVDGQLREAAARSGPFVARRQAAADTLQGLAATLAALRADDPATALDALRQAADARAIVAAWPDPPVVLPFWLRTTGSMLFSARRIAHAALHGDAAAARQAGQAYRRAARDARQADTALALAVSEAGASLASTPLARLADALAAVTTRRLAMASVLH
ncbi:MAG TPA: hypothetical protein VIA82_09610 [Candidatus Limnocylindria bacterium]|jgi:hypothetical protein